MRRQVCSALLVWTAMGAVPLGAAPVALVEKGPEAEAALARAGARVLAERPDHVVVELDEAGAAALRGAGQETVVFAGKTR